MTAVGADGVVPKLLALTVMYPFDAVTGVVVVRVPPGLPLYVRLAVIVPLVMATPTVPVPHAFWCGFHSDGSNQAKNVAFTHIFLHVVLKTHWLQYERFLMTHSTTC